jgi:acyl carrier protein
MSRPENVAAVVTGASRGIGAAIARALAAGVAPDVVDAVPARRAGRPEEVAAAMRFLASDEAARVTGTTLFVDGGLSAQSQSLPEEAPPMDTTITAEAVEETVIDALSQFGVDHPAHIRRAATLEELDIDSLDLAELSQIVEDEYGVVLDGNDVKNIKTVGDAIDLVVSRAA